ncbi:MAG: 4Fe-4S ferredoxin [Candidatus Methanoperedens sp.]|nr:MAG: 4Fe-4S ferredoxin [Candidatus Methanoperedens sp.]
MKRNIVFIDQDKCNGCGLCIPNCAEGAMKIIDGKAKLVDDRFCDGLGACLGHCPQDAIKTTSGVSKRKSSELRQWPVQLTLVSPQASYFKDSDFLAGKSLIIGCPKLDDAESYVDKLTEILKNNKIKTITLVNMEVSCCFGLQHIVEEAVQRAGKVFPIRQMVITIRGEKIWK